MGRPSGRPRPRGRARATCCNGDTRRGRALMSDLFIFCAVSAGGIGVVGLSVALFGGAESSGRCLCDGQTDACDARWS
jgi:hypothetical protein